MSTPPPKARRPARSWLRTAAVGLGALLPVVGYFVGDSGPAKAGVGDCVHSSGRDSLDKVACTDARADYRVLARLDGTTDTTRCARTRGSTARYHGSTGRRRHRKK
ncbi:hypothetical protein AB0K43_07005 [Kitasatospora sp. NPDC049258]|uniref:LppU/SCO3897 family protein n=1 Tax=Kitasatospora sp. NPDC049258 TaxID=3155394 RepID=UPI00343B44A4